MNRLFTFFLAVMITVSLANAQNEPLVSDPGQDQFDFCKQLYRQANATKGLEQRNQSYRELAPYLERYINRFPNHANTSAAMYYLGECYYQSGSLDESKRVFHRVISRYKVGRYVALSANRLGYDAFRAKKYGQAAVYFNKVAKHASTADDRFRARYQEASCYRYSGQTERAIKTFTVIEKDKGAPAVYVENAKLRLGYLYSSKKQLDKAYEKFSSLVHPRVADEIQVDAALNAGLLALQLDKNDEAESYLKSVLLSKKEKFKSRAQAALMDSMYSRKNFQGVFDVIKRGSYKGKASTEALKYILAGKSAYQLKKYTEAISLFAKAERQVPLSQQSFDAGYFRLLCFFNIKGANIPKQVDGFLQIYKPRFGRKSKIHKAMLMKAETLFDEDKFKEASAVYNQISAKLVGKDNLASLLYKRGWCLSESGDHNGAVRSFTEFLKEYPDDQRAARVIARRGKSYLTLDDRAGALRDFDLLIKKYPKDKLAALGWQNSARIKKEQQDYPEMIRRYDALLVSFSDLKKPTIANAQYWIGWGNYQLKEYKKAMPALEIASKLQPEIYGLKAQMLLMYSSFAMKDKARLETSVDVVMKKGQGDKIQSPIYRWLGVQCFNNAETENAEKYLTLGSTPDEPRQTPKSYWKILGATRVELGKNKEALEAIKHFLDVVEEPFWKAEALLDKAKAHLALKQYDDAKKAAEDGLALRPKGLINAELRLAIGDVAFQSNDFNAAAAAYVVVVEFLVNDKELRPKALHKAYQALTKKGEVKQAQHYLDILNADFPDYLSSDKAPDKK